MKIYIAASWRHQHAVEMLTALLRTRGHNVVSFVEKVTHVEDEVRQGNYANVTDWIWSPDGLEKFEFDVNGATKSDLVVYLGPSGTDAWAEVGAAWACDVPVLGLWAKGEPAGLMRRMVDWKDDYRELLACVCQMANPQTAVPNRRKERRQP